MINKGKVFPPKSHNKELTEHKDNELDEMSEREFRNLFIK
jgi:hypothetical protein